MKIYISAILFILTGIGLCIAAFLWGAQSAMIYISAGVFMILAAIKMLIDQAQNKKD